MHDNVRYYSLDSIMMLEADVVMGKLSTSDAKAATSAIPVMAHPPDTQSDISLQQFLQRVIDVRIFSGICH